MTQILTWYLSGHPAFSIRYGRRRTSYPLRLFSVNHLQGASDQTNPFKQHISAPQPWDRNWFLSSRNPSPWSFPALSQHCSWAPSFRPRAYLSSVASNMSWMRAWRSQASHHSNIASQITIRIYFSLNMWTWLQILRFRKFTLLPYYSIRRFAHELIVDKLSPSRRLEHSSRISTKAHMLSCRSSMAWSDWWIQRQIFASRSRTSI